MSGRKILGFLVLGLAIVLLVVILPVGASHDGTHMSSVDAKLGQYIDEEGATDIEVYRWQAMADYYEANDMLNFSYAQAEASQAFRWQAMADYYAQS